MSLIRNSALAGEGRKKIDWVKDYMPVLRSLSERYSKEKPFQGMKISVSVHLEAKTAYLCETLRDAGAEVWATGSNPLSTKDDVCAALCESGVNVFAWFGATDEEYREHILLALSCRPDIIIDDGGDLTAMLHGAHPECAENLKGGCEETTTGVLRLRARAAAGRLRFPMIAVNDAGSKRLFDNRHGTGQSVWDAVMHCTNVMISGKTVVVAGYGQCSGGIALRAKGLGADVIVTEVDPHRAIEAAMDGYRVMKMDDAAELGDIFITSTGCRDVLTGRHFAKMKNGVIMANAGHFDVEINKSDLNALAVRTENRKPFIDGYYMPDGRVLNLLAEGRLVNIAAGNGHPADIMDMSFAVQFLSALYISGHGASLKPGVYSVPYNIDRQVAEAKAMAMGISFDELSGSQSEYLVSE